MPLNDDDFPFVSEDPSLAQAGETKTILKSDPQELDDLRASMRLAVGSALNGWDAYVHRLRMLQASQEPDISTSVLVDDSGSFREQFRYLLLGILFETPDVFHSILGHADKASSKVYGIFSRLLSPFTNSWVFSPLRNSYDYSAARGEKVIDRLIKKGRIEEKNSRLIIQQQAIDDLINDFLEYVVLRTEATQIIQEGGIGMAGGVIDDFRDQSASVDTLLEHKINSLFRKRVPPASSTAVNKQPQGE